MDLQFIPSDNALSGFTKAGAVCRCFFNTISLEARRKKKNKKKRKKRRARTLLQGVGHEAAPMDVSMAASLELKVAPSELWPASAIVSHHFKS